MWAKAEGCDTGEVKLGRSRVVVGKLLPSHFANATFAYISTLAADHT